MATGTKGELPNVNACVCILIPLSKTRLQLLFHSTEGLTKSQQVNRNVGLRKWNPPVTWTPSSIREDGESFCGHLIPVNVGISPPARHFSDVFRKVSIPKWS